MKHFAKLNANNLVTDVVEVHDNEAPDEATGIAFLTKVTNHSLWKQYWFDGKGPTKNPAAKGNDYDPTRNAFLEARPWDSWILSEEDCQWHAPVAHPEDGKRYMWNEETRTWKLMYFKSENIEQLLH